MNAQEYELILIGEQIKGTRILIEIAYLEAQKLRLESEILMEIAIIQRKETQKLWIEAQQVREMAQRQRIQLHYILEVRYDRAIKVNNVASLSLTT